MIDKMSFVDFYKRYDDLAADKSHFNWVRKDMEDKEIRIKELELNQKTNSLFADWLGSNLNIMI